MNKRKNKSAKYGMKKMVLLFLSLLLVFSFSVTNIPYVASAQAKEVVLENTDTIQLQDKISASCKYTVEQVTNELFGEVNIKNCEYLYNLDDSADYIYVEFDDAGYAVFLKETMELLEYSAQGKLNYPETASAKYYGGPGNYVVKKDNCFIDTLSQESFYITENSARIYASEVREMLTSNSKIQLNQNTQEPQESIVFDYSILENQKNNISNTNTKTDGKDSGGVPSIDTSAFIRATDGTYIPNYRYFLLEPQHGKNTGGSCGAIAAQLLLSYHNYYSDRRIVANNHLNGGNAFIEANPNLCPDPMSMTSLTLGTRGYNESGSDDDNSYFHYVLNHIPCNAYDYQVRDGINRILEIRNEALGGAINYTTTLLSGVGSNAVASTEIINELDSGRPVILLMQSCLGGTNHYVVAYGYNNYKYKSEPVSYLGYITHYGQKTKNGVSYLNIWVNALWCSDAITLNVEHTHNYYTVGPISGTNRTEYKCSTCGHRTDAAFHMTASTSYMENVASIPQNGYKYKDFYVTFDAPGRKLFQTFGNEDAQIYLYDTENNQLAFNDDDGMNLNAMLYYTVAANTPYIVRVKFYDPSESGDVKVAVTPASYQCAFYEQIDKMTGTGESWCFDLYLGKTFILTFTPSASGSYKIWTVPADDIDTAIYVIDATSTNACVYDDNTADGLQATVTTNLTAGKSYFIVVSTHDIATEEGFVDFYASKVS